MGADSRLERIRVKRSGQQSGKQKQISFFFHKLTKWGKYTTVLNTSTCSFLCCEPAKTSQHNFTAIPLNPFRDTDTQIFTDAYTKGTSVEPLHVHLYLPMLLSPIIFEQIIIFLTMTLIITPSIKRQLWPHRKNLTACMTVPHNDLLPLYSFPVDTVHMHLLFYWGHSERSGDECNPF